MRYAVTGLVVTDTQMFNRTGQIGRWAEGINREFVRNSKIEAPSGADTGRINKTTGYPVGALRESISGEVVRVGPRQLQTTVSASVPYALYVLRGTKTIIARGEHGQFASAEHGLFIPANPGWGPARRRQRVRGQLANNFFERAFARTAVTHSSLRGYRMVGTL